MQRFAAITMALAAGLGMSACKKKPKGDAAAGGATAGATGDPAGGPTSAAGNGTGDTSANAAGNVLANLKPEATCPKSLGGTDKGLSRTIKKACGPVSVTEDYNVDGGELILEAGAQLVVQPNVSIVIGYYEPARLVVNGTAADPVIFTTGGDKAPGSWAGLRLEANAARSSITGAVFEYAGSDDRATIDVRAPDIVLKDSILRNLKGIGVNLDNDQVAKDISGNTFEHAGDIAMSLPPSAVAAVGTQTFKDGWIQIRGGSVTKDGTWRNPGTYYQVGDNVSIDGKNIRATVTVEPGVELRFSHEAGIRVGYYDQGGLKLMGTIEAPIQLKPVDGAEPGAWNGVGVFDKGELVAEHAIFQNGGGDDWGAIRNERGTTSLKECGFRGNSLGIYSDESSNLKSVAGCVFDDNKIAMKLHPNLFGAVAASNAYAPGQIIEISGGTINKDATWSEQPHAEIRIPDQIDITKATLTLGAGLELRFDGNAQLRAGYYDRGNVRVVGTADKPVTIRGVRDEAEAWGGLDFSDNADASAIEHLVIADTSNDAAIKVAGRARLSIKGLVVKRSKASVTSQCGAKIEASDVKLEGGTKPEIKPSGC